MQRINIASVQIKYSSSFLFLIFVTYQVCSSITIGKYFSIES